MLHQNNKPLYQDTLTWLLPRMQKEEEEGKEGDEVNFLRLSMSAKSGRVTPPSAKGIPRDALAIPG